MSIRNNNWLNSHATRRYPLDDNSTGTGDDGTRLKDDVIVDLHLRWPKIAGQYAFLGGVTVTPNIVTAVILAADSPTAASNFTPLAAITLQQPIDEYVYQPLDALYPGVGGFIAFGDTREAFSIRFSTPQQGLLAPKTGRPYDLLPVPSMRKFGRADSLTGLVKILAGPDIEIVKETVSIEGTDVESLVIRLQSPTSERNPLADYIGPCGKRPESQNCDRTGIQTINGVIPDCDGNIDIEFRGIYAANYQDCGEDAAGTTIDHSLGLGDVCPSKDPTRFVGQDECVPTSESSVSEDAGGGPTTPPPSESSDTTPSSEPVACEELPFLDCFDAAPHNSWSLKLGQQRQVVTDSPAEPCTVPQTCTDRTSGWSSFSLNSLSLTAVPWSSVSSYDCSTNPGGAIQLYDPSRRNVYIWDDCGTGSSLGKQVLTQLQLTNTGPQQNAGVVLNYQLVDPFTNPRINYWLAQINRNNNRVELLSFNGSNLIVENFATPSLPFALGEWYEVKATVIASGANALITVRVENISNPSWPVVSFSLLTSRYGVDEGHFGIHATQAVANFSYWTLQDA